MSCRRLFAAVIFLLSFTLTGCAAKEVPPDDLETAPVITLVEPADILAAVTALAPQFFAESPIDQSYLENYRYNLNQVWTDDGEQQYLAAFSNGLGYRGVAMIFLIEDGRKIPIYFNTHGERIESVRLFIPDYSDLLFLEVVSYGASGAHSGQRVEFLYLDHGKVSPAWEYMTASVDSRETKNGGAVEVSHTRSSWAVLPSYLVAPGLEGNGPVIYVSETAGLHLVDGEGKAVLLEETRRNLTYQWNPATAHFEEINP